MTTTAEVISTRRGKPDTRKATTTAWVKAATKAVSTILTITRLPTTARRRAATSAGWDPSRSISALTGKVTATASVPGMKRSRRVDATVIATTTGAMMAGGRATIRTG